MKNIYSISIPKPCHENWSKMTPLDKGRYCNSCSKTVIDFTKMDTFEIQDFIHQNKHNRICGHIKQTQLNSINLHIPSQILEHQQNFHKLFFLALLIVMGTSLLSCTNKQGQIQKIDSIEVVDSLSKQVIDIEHIEKVCDSVSPKSVNLQNKKAIPLPNVLGGIDIVETIGDIEIIEENPVEIDSINVFEIDELEGEIEIIEVVGLIIPERSPNEPLTYLEVENPPKFKDTPQNLSTPEERNYFKNKINDFVIENFNLEIASNLGFNGKQRLYIQFEINSIGIVKNIKARSIHHRIEQEAIRIINRLPQLIPARQGDKTVSIIYSFPIIFQVED